MNVFSVDYDTIDKSGILHIHKYLICTSNWMVSSAINDNFDEW